MAKLFDIKKFNEIIKKYNQNTQAISISIEEIIFNNGFYLTDVYEIKKCKNRVMGEKKFILKYFDFIYNFDEEKSLFYQQLARKESCRIGGKNAQKKHGEKIKKNMNNGIPWNKGMAKTKTYPYHYSCKESTKKLISEKNSGKKNGMFGVKMSDADKNYRSFLMKKRILEGKFTPNTNNRNTNWDSFYNNRKYRSSWEALYHHFFPEDEYETLRIKYFDTNKNKERITILDFVNHETKKVIEIKPKELSNTVIMKDKIKGIKDWCDKNKYKFILVDQYYLTSIKIPINFDKFDKNTENKIKKLYETCKTNKNRKARKNLQS